MKRNLIKKPSLLNEILKVCDPNFEKNYGHEATSVKDLPDRAVGQIKAPDRLENPLIDADMHDSNSGSPRNLFGWLKRNS